MDLLQKFNQELQTIQPPISKQKMMKITKLAIKNIKLYKHIVLSVEKYISRCPNSSKLSSLYVIDAIVRQSIHRLKDKDVYAARFARNFNQTFQYIFHSVPTHDKPKIVRVLNLWQRNGVFSAETIQPLLDLPNKNDLAPIEPQSLSADSPQTPLTQNPDESNLMLIQQIANTLALVKGANKINENQRFNYDHHGRSNDSNNNSQGLGTSGRRIMDFDYDDNLDNGDETPTEAEPPLSTTLSKIEMEQSKNELSSSDNRQESAAVAQDILSMPAILERWQKLRAQHLIVNDHTQREDTTDEKSFEGKDTRLTRGHESIDRQKSTRSRSRSNSPARCRTRYSGRDDESKIQSDSPSLKRGRNQRSRSRSRSRAESNKPNSDNKDRTSDDDRRRRGLPDMRKNCLTICSTTLWLGHVPKTVSEADISDAFGEFGTITSIDLIPPRGCAYVCMDRRQDAYKALNDLRNLKLSGSLIKMAWAPGKGLKDKEFKDYWEVYLGASFIPYSKLRPDLNIDTLEEGGVIDEDTMTDELKKMKAQRERDREEKARLANDQLVSLLPVQIASLTTPAQGLPLFPVPPNLTVPPPSLGCIQLPPLHRTVMNGDSFNEKGDKDNRITETSTFTEKSISPALDQVSIPLPPMSIPPPPIFSHAPPPFGLPPPPIPGQPNMPPLPIFQNPPPSIGQVHRLPFSNQQNYSDETENEDVDDQRSERSPQQQQNEYDDPDDGHNQNEELYQSNLDDQMHTQNQSASLMHHHMNFQTNPAAMNSQDDQFNYQMMPNNRPILQNMVMHPHPQQQQQNFCEYDQHGPPSQGRLLPVPDDNNLAHEFMANQGNSMYDFNCNPALNGPRPGYTNMQFNYDEFGYNGPPNEMNRWSGPPRPPGFVPRNVQRPRFRNGRGRERPR